MDGVEEFHNFFQMMINAGIDPASFADPDELDSSDDEDDEDDPPPPLERVNANGEVIPHQEQDVGDDMPSLEPVSDDEDSMPPLEAMDVDWTNHPVRQHLNPDSGSRARRARSSDSMPDLQSVSDSSDEDNESSSEEDAAEVEMNLEVAEDDGDSTWTDSDGDDDMPPLVPMIGNRRPRVSGDQDQDRDRRHPSQRNANPNTTNTLPRPGVNGTTARPTQAPPDMARMFQNFWGGGTAAQNAPAPTQAPAPNAAQGRDGRARQRNRTMTGGLLMVRFVTNVFPFITKLYYRHLDLMVNLSSYPQRRKGFR